MANTVMCSLMTWAPMVLALCPDDRKHPKGSVTITFHFVIKSRSWKPVCQTPWWGRREGTKQGSNRRGWEPSATASPLCG